MTTLFSPVVLDSINPENFPEVNIYVKQGDNFTLYRNSEMELTHSGLDRLRLNGVEFVYTDSVDSGEVLAYVESNLKSIIENDKLSNMSKNMVLGHIMMNDINEVFKNPANPETCEKCKKLLKQHAFQIDDSRELFDLMSKFSHYELYLLKHSAQVAILSMFVHKKLFSMSMDDLVAVGVGAMLHDVGMLDVSDVIHEKNGILTNNEFQRVRHHPRHGHDLLYRMGLTDPVSLSLVLDHHERYNGTGYPRQLFEDEIPRGAQVGAICDTFCALTTDRPYRPASTITEALQVMQCESSVFNAGILEAFTELIIVR